MVLAGTNLVRIPDGVSLRDAGIVGDAIATPYHVVTKRLRMRAGQRVAVLGAGGGLGVHMLQMIRAFGGAGIAVEKSREKASEIEARGLAHAIVIPTMSRGPIRCAMRRAALLPVLSTPWRPARP